MRVNIEDAKLYGCRLESGVRYGVASLVPADNHVLDPDSPFVLFLNPAGAVDILMPESNAANKGLSFILSNVSANAITLKTNLDAAFTTAIVLAGGETTQVICTGEATVLGWRGMATAASA